MWGILEIGVSVVLSVLGNEAVGIGFADNWPVFKVLDGFCNGITVPIRMLVGTMCLVAGRMVTAL